jgi:hypothetical protein
LAHDPHPEEATLLQAAEEKITTRSPLQCTCGCRFTGTWPGMGRTPTGQVCPACGTITVCAWGGWDLRAIRDENGVHLEVPTPKPDSSGRAEAA